MNLNIVKNKKASENRVMEPFRLSSKEDIHTAYDQGKEAVVALFFETFRELAERIQKLEDQLAKNSNNRGKSPSSAGLKKKPKSLRYKSGKKSGGQPGHEGSTLKMVEQPDQLEIHPVESSRFEKRQVFDVPPSRVEVTEHRAEIKECPMCHKTTTEEFSEPVSQPVQYGERIKAQMVYFNQQHHVPLERTVEILEDLYGQTLSEGTIVEACNQVAQGVEPVYQAIQAELIETKGTAHFDKTGARVEKKLWRLHVVCTDLLTYYAVHQNRGSKALDAIGIFPVFKGTAMHDGYKSYFQYPAVTHALCNAHH